MVHLVGVCVAVLCILHVNSQLTPSCPTEKHPNNDWWWGPEHNENCYYFVQIPALSYEEAMQKCVDFGATLVSVNDISEHAYLKGQIEPQYSELIGPWYTSGVNQFWEGDGTLVPAEWQFWLYNNEAPTSGRVKDSDVIVYLRKGQDMNFKRLDRRIRRPYVCEIAKAEVIRMHQPPRDYTYGKSEIILKTHMEVAPRMTYNPTDTIIIGKPKFIFMECIADGNPKPSYQWYMGIIEGQVIQPGDRENKLITTQAYPRYTLTNGRLTISKPDMQYDQNKFQCRVENKYGVLLGNPISLTFGVLKEFQNVDPSPVDAKGDKGAIIQCPPIEQSSGDRMSLTYQWSKDHVTKFVRPELNTHIFISSNGKLYFSRVQQEDAGDYYCIVALDSRKSQGYLGSQMIVSRISRPVSMRVGSADGGDQKPDILNDFIGVYPELPKVGDNIHLECFAFGTALEYKWMRYDKKNKTDPGVGVGLPTNHRFQDHNRILEIFNVTLEDSGEYGCSVYSTQTQQGDSRNRTLTIESPPIFTTPLTNQFLDVGSQLTWRCLAKGIPQPTYAWFHNADPIKTTNNENIVVNNNVIVIKGVDEKMHKGIYQCAATNSYGTTFSAAELRVLQVKPSFAKQHVAEKVIGARHGTVTFYCSPEAAPYPQFSWTRGGGEIASTPSLSNPNDKNYLTPDGTLTISNIDRSDAGRYECTATNDLGSAKISTTLEVLDATSITRRPQAQNLLVNKTANLYCEASHHSHLDMIYQWYFNDRLIQMDKSNRIRQGPSESNANMGKLSIRDIQFVDAGMYMCVARTQADSSNSTALIKVLGPPSEPAGVYVSDISISSTAMNLKWTDGDDHESAISGYIIEGSTNYDDWRVWHTLEFDRVPGSGLDLGTGIQRVEKRVKELNPGTSYRFRVIAINTHGRSRPSLPSSSYTTHDARPTKAPAHVGGGGGKVGVLTINWQPLSIMEHHGAGIGYRVFWRMEHLQRSDWHKAVLSKQYFHLGSSMIGPMSLPMYYDPQQKIKGSASKFVTLVGSSVNYVRFEVKVQAYNNLGGGPNSTVVVIHSAENLPLGTPKEPYGEGFNSTALRIFWIPVEDNLKEMRGKLIGYKINYWVQEQEVENEAKQAILPGQAESGLLIGLEPKTFYQFNIQAYNSAGNGPKSETYEQTTFNLPPQLYPTEVYVHSIPNEPGNVKVVWRGVSTKTGEEPLQGYIVRYWVHGTDIRNATDLRLGRVNEAKIHGIKKDFRYQLRVLGYSRGGFGKMSMPALTFVIHNSEVIIDQSVSATLAKGSHTTFCLSLISLTCLLSFLYISR